MDPRNTQASPPESEHSEAVAQEIARDRSRTATALAASETVSRHGDAAAEFWKGYRGIDNATGERFAKGLADISRHKVSSNPEEALNNIKQQAGFSAEVATTSRDNARAIREGSAVRTSRSDDLPRFGRNHPVVDRVQVLNGQIVEGSQTQMKFVGNRNGLLNDIAQENGKFARYRGVRLELPSEQFEGGKDYYLEQARKLRDRATKLAADPAKAEQVAKLQAQAAKLEELVATKDFQPQSAAQYCREQAKKRRDNAQKAQDKGNSEAAARLRREADNFDRLAEDVTDSGMTTQEAIFYRRHPEIATALDIARNSHAAGMEGARYGAVIGGSISLLQNLFATAQGEKSLPDAALDVSVDTAKAAALGYGTAFAGAAIKGTLQQSSRQGLRSLANTSVPTLTVTICLSLAASIKRYVKGEISEAQLLNEVGEKGAGLLCSSMMAALGQVLIPIPFVGAAIGGMIGYTLSSLFYQATLEATRGVEQSREALQRTRIIQQAARERLQAEQARLDQFARQELPALQQDTHRLFSAVSTATEVGGADVLAQAINHYAELLGKQLQFGSQDEFDAFMASDATFRF